MDRLDAMEVLLAVVDQGSLSAASRKLRSPLPGYDAVQFGNSRVSRAFIDRMAPRLRQTLGGPNGAPEPAKVSATAAP